jgi:hypothetical protein
MCKNGRIPIAIILDRDPLDDQSERDRLLLSGFL